jgi:hypothetical protein
MFTITLAVENLGEAIAEEVRSKIFDFFFTKKNSGERMELSLLKAALFLDRTVPFETIFAAHTNIFVTF